MKNEAIQTEKGNKAWPEATKQKDGTVLRKSENTVFWLSQSEWAKAFTLQLLILDPFLIFELRKK